MNNWTKKAKVIWLKETCVNQYVDFRCNFYVKETQDVFLNISVDSRYAVYVNGNFVPAFQYADYPEYKVYDSIDISEYVTVGENTLAIVGYYDGVNSAVYRKGNAGIIFAVTCRDEILCRSFEKTLCRQSLDFVSGPVERITEQLSFSFRYNAQLYDGWRDNDYNQSNTWSQAIVVEQYNELYERPVKQLQVKSKVASYVISQGVFKDTLDEDKPCGDIMQTAFLGYRTHNVIGLPSAITALPKENGIRLIGDNSESDGIYLIIDLGREEAGIFSIDIETAEETKILIGYGEHLEDMRIRTSVGGRQFAAVYNTSMGRNHFTYPFKRFGCRYISLHIYSKDFKLYYAGLKPTPYPLKRKENINLQSGIHSKILETCIRTLELCVHEHYEDCPWREQGLYAMDSQNQMLFGYSVFDNPELPRANLKLLALGQKENGLLELCAPARVSITIPAFSLCFISALKEYVEHIGDTEFFVEMLPYTEKILNYFISKIDNSGLVPFIKEKGIWNFYEWSAGLSGGDLSTDGSIVSLYDAPLNAFLLIALKSMVYLLNRAELFEMAEYYNNCAEKLHTALTEFWDADKGLFASYITNCGKRHYAELTQCLMICAGIMDNETEIKLLDKIADSNSSLVGATLSCTLYKYKAFLKHKSQYSDWIKADIEKIWGKMLYSGATSFWETADGAVAFDKAGSLCHGWSAVPIYYYFS